MTSDEGFDALTGKVKFYFKCPDRRPSARNRADQAFYGWPHKAFFACVAVPNSETLTVGLHAPQEN